MTPYMDEIFMAIPAFYTSKVLCGSSCRIAYDTAASFALGVRLSHTRLEHTPLDPPRWRYATPRPPCGR